jgi:hypothetical protein
MATTNTTNFSVTAGDIISAALRQLVHLGAGATPSSEDNTNLLFALQLIIKSLAADGYLLFGYKQASGATVASTATRTIGPSGANITAPKPVRIVQAWIRDSNNFDTQLTQLSRSDYNALSAKSATGRPVNFYYDNQVVSGSTWNNIGTVSLWPVPDSSAYTLFLSYQAPLQDVGGITTEFELPQEWFLPLQWILVDEVAMQYSVNEQKVVMIQQKAEFWRNKLADFSVQEVPSTYFAVDPQMGYGF